MLRLEASSMRGKVVVALVAVLLGSAGGASAAGPGWAARYTVRAGTCLALAQHYHVPRAAPRACKRARLEKDVLIGVVLRTGGRPGGNGFGVDLTSRPRHVSGNCVPLPRLVGAVRGGQRFRPGEDPRDRDPAVCRQQPRRSTWPTSSRTTPTGPVRSASTSATRNCARPLQSLRLLAVIVQRGASVHDEPGCFAGEWAAAGPPRSLYVNTAYSPLLARHVTPDCAAAAAEQRRRARPAPRLRGRLQRGGRSARTARGHDGGGRLARRRAGELLVVTSDPERPGDPRDPRAVPEPLADADSRHLLERLVLAADRGRLVLAERPGMDCNRRPRSPGVPGRLRRRTGLAEAEHGRDSRRRHGLLSAPRPLCWRPAQTIVVVVQTLV